MNQKRLKRQLRRYRDDPRVWLYRSQQILKAQKTHEAEEAIRLLSLGPDITFKDPPKETDDDPN